GGFLEHARRHAGATVRTGTLAAHLLAPLVADAPVRSDHLQEVHVVAARRVEVAADEMVDLARGVVLRMVEHPRREGLGELRTDRLEPLDRRLGKVPDHLARLYAGRAADDLGEPKPHAADAGEGEPGRTGTVEIGVGEPHDVAEIGVVGDLLRRSLAGL